MADLATLQRQFFDRVTAGVATDGLIATGELAIYANMYASRLYDALADDYPKLRAALGDTGFDAVVAGFLRAHPPSSFTLRDVGLALPSYLQARPEIPPWAAELAALERARVEVFDGPDARPLTQDEVIALDTELPALRLAWIPSSVLVPLTWAVDDLWSALEDGQPGLPPEPASRVVLVWRRELEVVHRTLDPDEGQLAPALVNGVAFAEVCEQLGGLHGDEAGARAAELLLRWLAAAALIPPGDAIP